MDGCAIDILLFYKYSICIIGFVYEMAVKCFRALD